MNPQKRKKKLILPKVQLRLVSAFFSCAAVATIVQAITLHYSLAKLADAVPEASTMITQRTPQILTMGLLASFVILTPLTLVVGIQMTFRIVGPMRRFQVYLEDLLAGEAEEDCKIRASDELQHFCELLNEATRPLQTKQAKGSNGSVLRKAG